MRILISNDDGLYSKGLEILIDFAKSISDDVWVVVPDRERSAGGHGVTVHNILRIKEISESVFTTSGTPADCVLLGIFHILKDKKPDLVLAGVNQGENIGDDLAYSGTIAVAREATMHRIKSIAFSQSYLEDYDINFQATKDNIRMAYEYVKDLEYKDTFYNINFPSLQSSEEVKGIRFVPQGRKARHDVIKKRVNDKKEEYFWLNVFIEHKPVDEDKIQTDIDAIANNYISVTPLTINFTNFDVLNEHEA